ncbi:MAG: HD domain-containing phosphohydrolase [Kofleriaceae bacterium]
MSANVGAPSVRLAELIGALSLGIDLGFGQPMEHVLRQCVIAMRIADKLDLPAADRATTYYAALLLNVGCHSDAHEQAKWFGDDLTCKASKYDHDLRSLRSLVSGLRTIGAGHAPLHRFRIGLEFAVSGHREVAHMIEHHAEISRELARQLGFADAVLDAIGASYERWDGRGWPGRLKGEAIPLAACVAQVAEFLEVAHRVDGIAKATKLARDWRGKHFAPAVAAVVASHAQEIFAELESLAVWPCVMAAEPGDPIMLGGERLDSALVAIGNFVDIKSPYFLGHAQAVADLASEAAVRSSMSPTQQRLLRHAGLLHGIGRLGVSNAILDKKGPLGPGEWERVRMQPYLTDRMLRQSDALAPVTRIAVMHRERIDGSGYPRAIGGSAIPVEARILAAADAYQAMCEPRPHRPARDAREAATLLRTDARAGRLDADAVEAVLGAAGHRIVRRREGPAGLTAREIEVLRLLARGMSNKEIAVSLSISAKTVANHVEHIYSKIQASTRAAASLFAMQHGLLPEHGFAGGAPN